MTILEFVFSTLITFTSGYQEDLKHPEWEPNIVCREVRLTKPEQIAECRQVTRKGDFVTITVKVERPWLAGSR